MKLNMLNAKSWLFLELVIITVVAWAVLDPAVVNLYYRLLPMGYDHDRLLYAECTVRSSNTDKNDSILDTYQITEERRRQMLRQLSAVEGVASVYLFNDNYGAVGYDNQGYTEIIQEGDTTFLCNVNFVPDARFFETYGLQPLQGSPSADELSHINNHDRQVVLTRSGAITLFGTADVVGRRFNLNYQELTEVTVAGVVEDFRKNVPNTLRSLIIRPAELNNTQCQYIIRLQEGINARRFVQEHGEELIRSGKTNFNRISRLMTYDDWLSQLELDAGRTQEVNRSLALALFFLVNLVLAVVGTVWLHAKRRTEECGVRRAFGATRRRVLFDQLWCNALLATAAVAVGLVIYLNYVYSGYSIVDGVEYLEHLYTNNYIMVPTDLRWPDSFWPHFLVVSVIVYLIILCAVLIATAIPAWRICRSEITEALKDE